MKTHYKVSTAAAKRIAAVMTADSTQSNYSQIVELIRAEDIASPESSVLDLMREFEALDYTGLALYIGKQCADEARYARQAIREYRQGQESLNLYELEAS